MGLLKSDKNRLTLSVEAGSTLDKRIQELVAAIGKREILTAINNLDRKVTAKMSELSDAVQSIKDDVVRIGDGVKAVIAKLEQPNPDVANAVAALKEADAGLDAAAEAMEATLNPPEG